MPESLTKDAFLAIDHDLRAFALVGAFMGFFALLEQGVDAAIGEVLEVKGIRRAVITRNMSFDDKIKTLRTLIDAFILDKDQAKRFDDLAKRARKIGEIRNIVAHTAFRRSKKSDGVEFFPLSASSTLKFPEMDWSIDEFLRHIDLINNADNELRSIENKLSIQRIAEALIQNQIPGDSQSNPSGGLFGLGEFISKQKSQTTPEEDPGINAAPHDPT